ncbi:MAG TPA: PIG-L family deacetylase [Dehalococcoidia bacterium]|nr:PIG-L family deacetylase [Dehalococcoidia bacterium]
MPLRLLCILAHPDDETLGIGGMLAMYADDPDVETHLLMVTRGEYGWWGEEKDFPGPESLGRVREEELRAAAAVLGVRDVRFLDYIDGHVDEADPKTIIGQMASRIRQVRPEVVVTFPHDGVYGHPDHIAVCQFATAAVVAATAPGAGGELPHTVSKLYYRANDAEQLRQYEKAFGELVMIIDGIERRSQPWERWVMTTRLDARPYWERVWQAVLCHRSQLPGYEELLKLRPADHELFWGSQDYYRVFSLVNGGRSTERDLFEGLRAVERL